jgi:hypothetical protein
LDLLLIQWSERVAGTGRVLVGLLQRAPVEAGRPRCAIEVEILPDHTRMRLSEDRGPGARGCRLDQGRLIEALAMAETELPGADVLVLNRFGKVEAEGGGGRDLIAAAMTQQIPVVVAVPWRNISAFRAFAAGLAQEVTLASLAGRSDPVAALWEAVGLPRLPALVPNAERKVDGPHC